MFDIKAIITELASKPNLSDKEIYEILQKGSGTEGKVLSKSRILAQYRALSGSKEFYLSAGLEANFLSNITMKKTRTLSGVTTVTVLTKPFPCPGKCIFCPNDVRMPKSYISSEPGAQRAEANQFDPYLQTYNRLLALSRIGHPTDKVELIVLGGTWTAYREEYQIWFIKRCFDAMNEFNSENLVDNLSSHENVAYKPIMKADGVVNYNLSVSQHIQNTEFATWQELKQAQIKNVTSNSRCVGLALETRPDEISTDEVIKLRRLGATKVQIGVQSLNDVVLKLNKRGHDSSQTAHAFELLRQAGFKIHAHYMPNLYGSSVVKDIQDFKKLFTNPSYRPDELKIYPCSLIAGTELMTIFNMGKWAPYSSSELLQVLSSCLQNTPRYCRVTRMIRDIPSPEIVAGNKLTNFRQITERYLQTQSGAIKEIRSREIKGRRVSFTDLFLHITKYKTTVSTELFLEFVTKDDSIVGFLRLSLPTKSQFIKELYGCAMIREVHVYGNSLEYGKNKLGLAQHSGIGSTLVYKAIELASKAGFYKLAVISAIGTRNYYKRFGFELVDLYQVLQLPDKNVKKPRNYSKHNAKKERTEK